LPDSAPPLAASVLASGDPAVVLAVLIPALDCAATIGAAVIGARRHVDRVVVVDDGSQDDTGARATAAGAEVTRHAQRCGKGKALISGMRLLAQRGVTHAITMDGDGQHLPDQIPHLLAAAREWPNAIVLGDRHMETVTTKPINKFGNRFANRWVEIACGQALPDTQSGFRVYPLAAVLALGARARHFAFETEVLIRAAREGIPIHSVAVEVYYPPVHERVTHFRPVMDTIRIIAVVLRLIFRLP